MDTKPSIWDRSKKGTMIACGIAVAVYVIMLCGTTWQNSASGIVAIACGDVLIAWPGGGPIPEGGGTIAGLDWPPLDGKEHPETAWSSRYSFRYGTFENYFMTPPIRIPLWPIAVAAFGLGGFIAWQLRQDAQRMAAPPSRCRKCKYSLVHLPTFVCPECGHDNAWGGDLTFAQCVALSRQSKDSGGKDGPTRQTPSS